MASEPNVVSLCERGDSDPHAPFGAPDPKSSTPPTETPKQGKGDRTEPHGSAPPRTEHVTNHVTSLPRYGPAVLRALASLDDADEARGCGAPEAYGERSTDFLVAQARLLVALQEERARRAAVPALPDEGERDPSPHRFAHPHGGPL